MREQLALGGRALARASVLPGAPTLDDEAFRRTFETSYVAAVELAGIGRTMTPAAQLRDAASRVGRRASEEEYLSDLGRLVREMPFEEAPGASELLRSLTEDGYWVAVISNTVGEPGSALRPVLRSMGFDRFVRRYTFSDELPWTKPAPEIFWTTLEGSHVERSDAIHVGDGWSDIEGARRAGLRAGILYTGLPDYGPRYRELFFPKGGAAPPTDHHADNLDEVGRLVRRILPSSRALT